MSWFHGTDHLVGSKKLVKVERLKKKKKKKSVKCKKLDVGHQVNKKKENLYLWCGDKKQE